MLRARLACVVAATSLGLVCGCENFSLRSLFTRRSASCPSSNPDCLCGGMGDMIVSEGPSVVDSGPIVVAPAGQTAVINPPVFGQTPTVAPQPRLVPQPQSQPSPYTPTKSVR